MAERIFSRTWVSFLLLAAGLTFPIAGCVEGNVDIPDYYDRDEDRHTRRDDRWEDRDHHRDYRDSDRDHDRDRREDRDRDRRHRGKLDKDEARDIAKDLIESRGMEADHFEIKDKEIDGAYWILFEHKRKERRCRKRHRYLAVRVARGRGGKTHVTLYMDGQERDFSRRMDKDKVKKKEAYRFAERMAERHGASLHNYKIKDKKIDGNYWILFERVNPPRGRSWKNHFTVRVSKRGIATFYKR